MQLMKLLLISNEWKHLTVFINIFYFDIYLISSIFLYLHQNYCCMKCFEKLLLDLVPHLSLTVITRTSIRSDKWVINRNSFYPPVLQFSCSKWTKYVIIHILIVNVTIKAKIIALVWFRYNLKKPHFCNKNHCIY